MSPYWTLAGYCVLVAAASLAGGIISHFIRLTHVRIQLAISFIGGAMLGVGLLHLLPHGVHALGEHSLDEALLWLVGGFLAMFFIERVFHSHHHEAPDDDEVDGHDVCCEHDHDHDHDHSHDHDHDHDETAHAIGESLGWGAALVGLTLHSLLDGVALAASVLVESTHGGDHGSAWWGGLGVFLVVFLHKPFDSLTLATLLKVSGKSPRMQHWVNVLYALAMPAGAVGFALTAGQADERMSHFIGAALAFAAGTFLCIATSDLLPELQFHHHDRWKLSTALVAGLGLSWAIGFLETSGHDRHAHPAPTNSAPAEAHDHGSDHDHDGHDHDH